jgi:hypothetical protein
MHLDLTDEEAAALIKELRGTIQNDRYPLSPRILALKGILDKLSPEPAREPLPPQKMYEPPSKGRYRRRGWALATLDWERRKPNLRARPARMRQQRAFVTAS